MTTCNISNSQLPATSFHKLTADQLREMFSLKLINATAYVLLIVQANRAANWRWKFKVKDFCQDWGIHPRSFYRAIAKLKSLGKIQWQTDDSVTVWWTKDSSDRETDSVVTAVTDVSQPTAKMPVEQHPGSSPDSFSNNKISTNNEMKSIACCGLNNLGIRQPDDRTVVEPVRPIRKRDRVEAVAAAVKPVTAVEPVTAVTAVVERAETVEPDEGALNASFNEVRSLGVKLNFTVRKTIVSYFANVQEAIEHLKERILSGENFRCVEAAFVKAVKDKAKSVKSSNPQKVYPQPSTEQIEALKRDQVTGNIRGFCDAPYRSGRAVIVDDPVNRRCLPWWEWLGIIDPKLQE